MQASSWRLFFASRRRHTRFDCDWSSDVCSSDLRFAWGGKTLQATSLQRFWTTWTWSFGCSLCLPWVVGGCDNDKMARAFLEDRWLPRSEERRVGKECRSRWSPDH